MVIFEMQKGKLTQMKCAPPLFDQAWWYKLGFEK